MKTKKESNEIKEEVEKLDKKLYELTEEELEQVTGGVGGVKPGAGGDKFVRGVGAVGGNGPCPGGGDKYVVCPSDDMKGKGTIPN